MTDISPLIQVVQIEQVRVVSASMRTTVRSADEAGAVQGNIGRTTHVVQRPQMGLFVIRIDFVFGAHPEQEKKPKDATTAVVAVNVSFELTYRIPENMSTSDEQLEEFARVNGVFNAWPYFREFVHASLARMGLPPLILPVYRLSKPKRPATDKSLAPGSSKGTKAELTTQ
jgi:hypothetical protein